MSRVRILAIDDDEAFLEELKETLSLSGYDITVFSKAEDALVKINELNPQVLLLDLKMYPKSGFQIAEEIQHFSGWSHFKGWKKMIVISMSGYFKEQKHQEIARDYGVRSFLTKPIHPTALIELIERELSLQENSKN